MSRYRALPSERQKWFAGVRLAAPFLLLLSGCTIGKSSDKLRAGALPPSYDTDLQPEGQIPRNAICWRHLVTDDIARSVTQALAHSDDVAVASARLDQAEGLLRQRLQQNRPGLETTAGTSINRTTTGATAAGALLERLYPEISKDIGIPNTASYPLYETRLTMTEFEVDLWGKLRNLTAAARNRVLAEAWNRKAIELALLRELIGLHVRLAEISAQREATLTLRSLTAEQSRISEQRERIGLENGVEVFTREDRLHTLDSTLAQLSLEEATLRHALDALSGGTASTAIQPNFAQFAGAYRLDAGLPSTLLLQRPDILSAEYRVRAAQGDVGAARAMLFPTIRLTGLFGFASTELDSLFSGNAMLATAGGVLDLPIFDLAKRRANVRLNQAKAAEAFALYRKAVRGAFRDVSDALAARRWYDTQLQAGDRRIGALAQVERLSRTREAAGLDDGRATIAAKQDLIAAQAQQSALRAREIETSLQVYVSVGGPIQCS
ncbi:TolC family protein [uncultured Sphingomonas sp.]|uniref:TolC family protein n=1 Tax=uncultured Sphingomonas sp. TaxID=158754 RepID=UPI0025DD610C|nr:TolC family protein [uncultured Sphingomonas sp.]